MDRIDRKKKKKRREKEREKERRVSEGSKDRRCQVPRERKGNRPLYLIVTETSSRPYCRGGKGHLTFERFALFISIAKMLKGMIAKTRGSDEEARKLRRKRKRSRRRRRRKDRYRKKRVSLALVQDAWYSESDLPKFNF